MKSNPDALEFASDRVKDSGVVVIAIAQDGLALRFALGYTRHDRDVCREAVFRNGLALRYVPDRLKSTLDIVLTAVRNRADSVVCLPAETWATVEFAEKVADCDHRTCEYMPSPIANRAGVRAAAKAAEIRIARRRLPKDDLKSLITKGMTKGTLMHQDILDALPTYALSEHEIADITDLLEYDMHVPVFADEKARSTPETSLAWRRGQTYRELFLDPFLASRD